MNTNFYDLFYKVIKERDEIETLEDNIEYVSKTFHDNIIIPTYNVGREYFTNTENTGKNEY